MAEQLMTICKWCKGLLGPTLTQEHDNPGFAEYKVCTNCDYQWAKQYWDGLEKK